MSNHAIHNINLSCKALGLMLFMWSLHPNWDFSVEGLATVRKEGRDAIKAMLKELEDNGYLTRQKARDKGRFSGYDYALFEEPLTEKPSVEKPSVENPTQYNIKLNNTKRNNIKDIKNKQKENCVSEKEQIRIMLESYTSNQNLLSELCDFYEVRLTMKPKPTALAMKRILNELDKLASTDDEKIEILNNSIMNGWKGVFPLKRHNASGNQNQVSVMDVLNMEL